MLPLAKPTLRAVLELLIPMLPFRQLNAAGSPAQRTKVRQTAWLPSRHNRTTPGLHRTNVRHTRYGMYSDGQPSRGWGVTTKVAPPDVNRRGRRPQTAPREAWTAPKGRRNPPRRGDGGRPILPPFPLRGRGTGGGGGVAFAKRMHGYAPQARPVSRGAAPDGSPLTCTQVTGLPFGAEGGRPP